MEAIASGVRLVHVIFGFAGLAAFWVPLFTRKGGQRHVLFGRIFEVCAWVVLAGAALSVGHRLYEFSLVGEPPDSARFAFVLFLGYLTLVTGINLRHALAALRTRKAPERMRTPLNTALAWLAIAASAALIAYALTARPPNRVILLALSPIGFGIGYGNLKYLRGRYASRQEWFYQHLGGMLGAGIAFHTAFAVFGAAQLFDIGLSGAWSVIPWIAPAAIGIPAIALWTRYYKRRFGDLPGGAA